MNLLRFTKPFCPLISFILLRYTVVGIELVSINYKCGCSSFTSGEGFESNLNSLISALTSNAPQTGFAQSSQGQNSDQVQGLALCTGNVGNQGCHACLQAAVSEIQRVCVRNKEAVIWYNSCMLKYSSQKFPRHIDRHNWFYHCSPDRVTNHVMKFKRKQSKLLRGLIRKAHNNPTRFAAGEIEVGSEKIYGLLECARDLSSFKCGSCLRGACLNFVNGCSRNKGGKFYSGSCSIRTETYKFF